MNLRQAAQQALEALEYPGPSWPESRQKIAAALREALAEREQEQEPVAWMVCTLDGKSVCVTDNPADFTDQHKALPLYTHPVEDTAVLQQALVALKQITLIVEYGTPASDTLTAQQVTDMRLEIGNISRAAITALRERLKEKV